MQLKAGVCQLDPRQQRRRSIGNAWGFVLWPIDRSPEYAFILDVERSANVFGDLRSGRGCETYYSLCVDFVDEARDCAYMNQSEDSPKKRDAEAYL